MRQSMLSSICNACRVVGLFSIKLKTSLCVLVGIAVVGFVNPAISSDVLLDVDACTQTGFFVDTKNCRGSVSGENRGWALFSGDLDVDFRHFAVFPTIEPLNVPVGAGDRVLTFTLKHVDGAPNHSLGHFALAVTGGLNPNVSSNFIPLEILDVSADVEGVTFTVTGDDVLVGGTNSTLVTYTVRTLLSDFPNPITGFRLEAIDSNGSDTADADGLDGGGPGRASNGNFVLSRILGAATPDPLPTNPAKTTLVSGPLKDDGSSFDIDGDGVDDLGLVIGVAQGFSQHYAFDIDITNTAGAGALDDLAFLEVVPTTFALDPTREDLHSAGASIDEVCDDGVCDGISSVAACPVSVTGPTDPEQIVEHIIVIEAIGLGAGATCKTTVFVATRGMTGKGKGKKKAKFEPTSCTTVLSDSGIPVTNTVTLNVGVKTFDTATNDLLFGPTGSFPLKLLGCP